MPESTVKGCQKDDSTVRFQSAACECQNRHLTKRPVLGASAPVAALNTSLRAPRGRVRSAALSTGARTGSAAGVLSPLRVSRASKSLGSWPRSAPV